MCYKFSDRFPIALPYRFDSVPLLVARNSEFGTRASVGAVYDRAFFRSLTTVRGHRPRLQWYQSHCYAPLEYVI